MICIPRLKGLRPVVKLPVIRVGMGKRLLIIIPLVPIHDLVRLSDQLFQIQRLGVGPDVSHSHVIGFLPDFPLQPAHAVLKIDLPAIGI